MGLDSECSESSFRVAADLKTMGPVGTICTSNKAFSNFIRIRWTVVEQDIQLVPSYPMYPIEIYECRGYLLSCLLFREK